MSVFAKEKRAGKRIRYSWPLTFRFFSKDSKAEVARRAFLQNISTQGMLVLADIPVPVGANVEVLLEIPERETPLQLSCMAVRSIQEKETKNYLIGLLTTFISEKADKELRGWIERSDICRILEKVDSEVASDIHFSCGSVPMLRVEGELKPMPGEAVLTKEGIKTLLYSIMSEEQIMRFEKERELNFFFSHREKFKYRVNVHFQRGNIESTLRTISAKLGSLKELHLPEILRELVLQRQGLILIAGQKSCGKSTTLNSLVELVNKEKEALIVCLENPIEYVFTNKKSLIKQREIGLDTLSFALGVENALHQDPDIVMIAEVNDAETARNMLIAADSGCLVLASILAPHIEGALTRLISFFEPPQQPYIGIQLADCLQAVVAQLLLPRQDGKGKILVSEFLRKCEPVQGAIRQGKFSQLKIFMESGSLGMYTFEQSLQKLSDEGLIGKDVVSLLRSPFGNSLT